MPTIDRSWDFPPYDVDAYDPDEFLTDAQRAERDRGIRDAAMVAAEAFSVLYEWPLDAAAERSRRPHESVEDARARIEARRGLRLEQRAVA